MVVVVGGGGCIVQKPEQLSLQDEQSRAEREAELVNIYSQRIKFSSTDKYKYFTSYGGPLWD